MEDRIQDLLHSQDFERYELEDGEIVVYDSRGTTYVQREFKIGSPTYNMFEELYDIVPEGD